MALERVPADIRAAGGIARMADPTIVKRIMEVVSIPVMAKARIGHFVEARILEALGVDYIDESEVLTPADDRYHIDKRDFTVPLRLRLPQPGRSPAPHRRRRGHDPHQGRTRHRQRGGSRAPLPPGHGRDPCALLPARGRSTNFAKENGAPWKSAWPCARKAVCLW